ncbi:hypothetical protein ElyMa_004563800 [Elysia marginata]|uniref:Uncharacterized protein n=1 Tax=Elysia marginata TaxID=1093978 RepID=A0AAV4HRF8_9GAST|nr:hypothetical protein ElyMa_004563800 [Elysia marginata]
MSGDRQRGQSQDLNKTESFHQWRSRIQDSGLRIGRLFDILTSLFNYKIILETALETTESVLPHFDVRSACTHHTQSHCPDTGPTRLSTESIMPDAKQISC